VPYRQEVVSMFCQSNDELDMFSVASENAGVKPEVLFHCAAPPASIARYSFITFSVSPTRLKATL